MSKKLKIIALIVVVIISILGIPEYIFLVSKTAEAFIEEITTEYKNNDNYIEDYYAYKSKTYDTDGKIDIGFKVKTSFCLEDNIDQIGIYIQGSSTMASRQSLHLTNCTDGLCCLTAGNTYKGYVVGGVKFGIGGGYERNIGGVPYYMYFQQEAPYWYEYVYLQDNPNPLITLTFPATEQSEINGDFNIQGTVIQPSPYEYNQIMAYAWFSSPLIDRDYSFIGTFRTDLEAIGTQEFSIPIIGLPISSPYNIIIYLEVQKVDDDDIIRTTYREEGGVTYPWAMKIKTTGIGTQPGEWPPEWEQFFDIYRPKPSSDGYYKIKTPTSTVEFTYRFPETYKVKITQDEEVKLATSTFGTLDPDGNSRFEVENIDASTSTVKWLKAEIYNTTDDLLITALFPILGLAEGELEDVGILGIIENIIKRALESLFVPSQTTLEKFKINLPNQLKSRVPFSYFYDIKTAISSIDSGTETTIPGIEYTVGTYTFAFNPLDFNATGLAETEGWQTFYNIMKMSCWLMFVLYLFGRIRDRTTNTAD